MSWEPVPQTTEQEQLAAYRSLSVLALCALLLGGLSIIAFVAPGAWLVPVAAILSGALALRRIQQQPEAITGRPLALAGLALGLFFFCCAPAHYFATRWLLQRDARAFITEWLQTIADRDLNKAHQAVLSLRHRQPQGTQLEEYYSRQPEEALDRDNFFSQGIYQRLKEQAPGSAIQFERHVGIDFSQSTAYIAQRYTLHRPGSPMAPLHVEVTATRDARPEGASWTLYSVADAAERDRLAERQGH